MKDNIFEKNIALFFNKLFCIMIGYQIWLENQEEISFFLYGDKEKD